MTALAFTRNYITQQHLDRAYRDLGHTSKTREWEATLLIDDVLDMWWACPGLRTAEERVERPAAHGWHIIAKAGELDWPPLRPEEEIWPALLAKEPVPTGERAEREARFLGRSIEEAHMDRLRTHYLSSAHIGGIKRNPTDVNFDPVVRDWKASARELAGFIDGHRPPKLTTEQRVMVQGVRLAEYEDAVERTKLSMGRLMRNAARDARGADGRLRHGFKADMTRWSGKSRPTVDDWLSDGGCCEGTVPTDTETPEEQTHEHRHDHH
jgi:hypothetical protein